MLPAVALFAGCSNQDDRSGPLSPSPFETLTTSSAARAAGSAAFTTGAANPGEDFDCTNLLEVRERFNDPGFICGRRVGMYLRYIGLPPGESFVEIIWDEENAPSVFETIRLLDFLSPQRDTGLFDVEMILEHHYSGITEEVSRRVRATLFYEEMTGSCARVRHITVGPGVQSGTDGLPLPTEGTPAASGADLSVTATPPADPVDVSSPFGFSVNVVNLGPEDASGVSLKTTLPSGFLFLGFTNPNGVCTSSGQMITCVLGSITNGGNATVALSVQAPTVSGIYNVAFTASGVQADSFPPNNTDITVRNQLGR